MSALVRTAALTNYFEVAQQLGLDPDPLLDKASLSRETLADSDGRIPLTPAVLLLEESARLTRCPTFGLRMAESRRLSDFGEVSLLIKHQRTLRDALTAMIHYQHLVNEALAISLEDAGSMVILRVEVMTDSAVPARQANELALGVVSRMCSSLLGAHWRPYSVNFTHAAPHDLRVHRRIFKGRIEFGSDFNGIVCSAADLNFPNPLADPAMARYAERFVEGLPGHESSIVVDVRKAIYQALPSNSASIEEVAQALGMNVRTLQRRLDDAGEIFSELVNGVRRELVVRYLENPEYSMGRIAQLLGYSVPASFTRWFTAQFGMAPVRWRSRARH